MGESCSPVVDYLNTLEEVDPSAIALAGLSFGGFLAPRASAFVHRLVATLALDGLYEFGPLFLKQFPPAIHISRPILSWLLGQDRIIKISG